MSGNSVIRAFNKESPFTDHMLVMLNKNTLSNEITTAVWSWYSIRVDLLSVIVLACGCCMSVYFKTQISPVLLALLIQYLLTLQSMCNYCLYNFGEIERQMVCV